jgi:prepilin-type processing-associated H-X9-DG protein
VPPPGPTSTQGAHNTLALRDGPAVDVSGGSLVATYCFGSPHPAGFNAVYCDGSVVTITFSVNPGLLGCLGVRNDSLGFNYDELPR